MRKLGPAGLVTITEVQAVGLVRLEVGDGRDLQPALLRGGPELEIVGDGGGEGQVPAAQAQDPVLQSELVHQRLHVGDHIVQGLVGILRLLHAHDLDLVELVQAVQAADILAVRTGLAAEARRVGRQALRNLVGGEDHVTEDVGHGDLGGRDHIEVVQVGVVHLALLIGELARAETGSGVDHHRGLDLLVAGRGVAVEEEVDQRPLELGALALVDRETGTRDLDAQVEVDDVVLLGELPVRQGPFGELHLGTARLDDLVVLGTLAGLDQRARGVGHQHELAVQLGGSLVHPGEELAGAGLEGGHLGLGGLGRLAQSLLHQAADPGSLLLLLREQRVALGLEPAPERVELEHLVHDRLRVEILDLQFLDDRLRVIAKHLQCQHIPSILNRKDPHLKTLKCWVL